MNFGEVQASQKREISAGMGILILLGVVGAVYAASHWHTVTAGYGLFSMLVNKNADLFASGLGAAVLGITALAWRFSSLLAGLKKDKSVDALKKGDARGPWRIEIRAMAVATVIALLTSGKLKGYLFVVWSKVSCCRELAEVATAVAAIAAMNIVCQGMGNL